MAFGSLSVKGRALRYLSQREHSRLELERKLARHVADLPDSTAQQQIAAALDELTACGLLCEQRVADSVLSGQGQRFGSHRLKQTLQSKGLPPAMVAQTLQQARGTELERALQVWQRRFGAAATDAAERARQMRFLAGRGFDADVIRRVVAASGDDDQAHRTDT